MKIPSLRRGHQSYGRNRNTLHKSHLEEFKTWLDGRDGWKVQSPTGHEYEVLYAIKSCPQGPLCQSFIYHNNHNDHLTVQADLVPMMHKWLQERKDARRSQE